MLSTLFYLIVHSVEDAQKYLSDEAAGALKSKIVEVDRTSEADILTRGDFSRIKAGLPPQNYDGFVLFADEDIEFATKLVEKMEEAQFKVTI